MSARWSAAAERNRRPILAVLERVLPRSGVVLEIASGTGQHAAWFAAALQEMTWQPSDPDPDCLDSIRAHIARAALVNLREPVMLDVHQWPWPVGRADAVVCINMLHIAPWSATQALLAGCAQLLPQDAPLVIYGPFRRTGVPTAPSNEAFDASLRARDPHWGLRELDAVAALAQSKGLILSEVNELPANNVAVVFRRDTRPSLSRSDGAASPE